MKYRKLRIAWSALFGLLVVLVIVLWVRSHWWFHSWLRNGRTDSLYIQLFEGELKLSKISQKFPNAQTDTWYPGTFSAEYIATLRESDLLAPDNPQGRAYIGPLRPIDTLNVAYYPT